jgi:simple sugar transport system permease protein
VAAGALWAGLAGWMKVRFNANEVITTLMLTYVANCFLLYLVNGPMQDPSSDLSQSAMVPEAMKLARLIGTYRLHSGIFLLALVCILMCFFWRTSLGYSIDLVGQGRKVATYAGIPVDRTILVTMLLSGGLAGLAGWIETFGIQYRILDGIAANYGDIANIIALLGALNPFGIMASALFFAALMVGGASMQRMTEVPYSVVDVIQGLIIIFVVAKALFRFRRSGRAAHREGAAHAQ